MCPDKRQCALSPPSTIPFPNIVGDRPKQVRLGSMILEMLDRLVDQHRALSPRPLLAEQRNEGRLPGGKVLAQPLACGRLVPRMIEQVVGDLEREADVASIAAIGRARL